MILTYEFIDMTRHATFLIAYDELKTKPDCTILEFIS
jgi:hypothetical protein